MSMEKNYVDRDRTLVGDRKVKKKLHHTSNTYQISRLFTLVEVVI